MKQRFKNRGQAVLIILLVVGVALGLGLSIISQSTTDVKISEQEQQAARAFNAAEAGIEEALKDVAVGDYDLTVDGIPVSYSVTGLDFIENQFKENETAQVLLGNTANTIRVEWVKEGNAVELPGGSCSGAQARSNQTGASLLINVIASDGSITSYGLNACSLSGSNNMTNVGTGGTDGFLRRYDINVTASDEIMRIRPIYNTTSIRVAGQTSNLPTQSFLIDSKAQVETQEAKAIEVTRNEPASPSVFDYVLFSGQSLVHQ